MDRSAFSPRSKFQIPNEPNPAGEMYKHSQNGQDGQNHQVNRKHNYQANGIQSPNHLIKPKQRGNNALVKVGSRSLTVAIAALLVGIAVGVGGMLITNNLTSDSSQNADRIVGKVQGLSDLGEEFEPEFVEEITDIESLRAENVIHAEIYADAQNGDWTLVSDDKLIIYRNNNQQVVYEGPTPEAQASINLDRLKNKINQIALESEIISETDNNMTVRVVTNPDNLLNENAEFYSEVQVGHVIVFFQSENKIALYNSESEEIYQSGKLNTIIE